MNYVEGRFTNEQVANAKVWYDALMSGLYRQIKSCMIDTQGNCCCLGVATHVIGFPGRSPDETLVTREEFWKKPGQSVATSILPPNVSKGLGLDDEETRQFALLNDAGRTFRYIAELVKGLYVGEGEWPNDGD